MSSRDGLARADIDTGLFDDPKVKRLARLQRNGRTTAITMTLFVATVLTSWRQNRPVSIHDAAPAWCLFPIDKMVADLVAVGMIADDGTIPSDRLDHWMSGVRARIEGGRAGAEKRWGNRDANGYPQGSNSAPNTHTSQPASQPDNPARSRARKRETESGPVESLRDILRRTTGEPTIATEGKPT